MGNERSPYDDLVNRVDELERVVTALTKALELSGETMQKLLSAQKQLFRYVSTLKTYPRDASPVVNVIHKDEHES